MRITCPSCHAAYEVPDGMLGAARKVRCARCAFEWLPEPPIAPPPPPSEPPPPLRVEARPERPPRLEPLPPLPPPERMPASAMRQRSRPPPVLASLAVLAISVVVLVSLGWAAYAWRAEVMHAWPPSQRLFEAFGLT